jgi:hypothetical protein
VDSLCIRSHLFSGHVAGADFLLLGTTVFRGKRNFAPSRGICALPRKTYIAAEFRGIGYFWGKKHVLHDSDLFS